LGAGELIGGSRELYYSQSNAAGVSVNVSWNREGNSSNAKGRGFCRCIMTKGAQVDASNTLWVAEMSYQDFTEEHNEP
jgi:hypothetical protein